MPEQITRQRYLLIKVMVDSECDAFTAMEAVSSTALAHPEWDLDEKKTWKEWEDSHE
jgi:hypothetical protein